MDTAFITSAALPRLAKAEKDGNRRRSTSRLARLGRFARGLELHAVRWMAVNAMSLLKASLGLVFLLFGSLKFFPGLSPAEGLAGETLSTLSFGLLQPAVSLPLLGAWECLLGIGLIAGIEGGARFGRLLLRLTIPALFLHLLGTASPLFLAPTEHFCFQPGHHLLTLECQYILKNVVLVSAAIAVGGSAARNRPSGII